MVSMIGLWSSLRSKCSVGGGDGEKCIHAWKRGCLKEGFSLVRETKANVLRSPGYVNMYMGYLDSPPSPRHIGAHQFLCWLRKGPPPCKECNIVCHSCNRKDCLNPLHLRWGTAQENREMRAVVESGGKWE